MGLLDAFKKKTTTPSRPAPGNPHATPGPSRPAKPAPAPAPVENVEFDISGEWGGNAVISYTKGNYEGKIMMVGRSPATFKKSDWNVYEFVFPDDKTYTVRALSANKLEFGPDHYWTRA